jgi:hypothetical protein
MNPCEDCGHTAEHCDDGFCTECGELPKIVRRCPSMEHAYAKDARLTLEAAELTARTKSTK